MYKEYEARESASTHHYDPTNAELWTPLPPYLRSSSGNQNGRSLCIRSCFSKSTNWLSACFRWRMLRMRSSSSASISNDASSLMVPDSPDHSPIVSVRLSGTANVSIPKITGLASGSNSASSESTIGASSGRSLLRSRAESIFGESGHGSYRKYAYDSLDASPGRRRRRNRASEFDDDEGALCCGAGGLCHILTCGKYCGDGQPLYYLPLSPNPLADSNGLSPESVSATEAEKHDSLRKTPLKMMSLNDPVEKSFREERHRIVSDKEKAANLKQNGDKAGGSDSQNDLPSSDAESTDLPHRSILGMRYKVEDLNNELSGSDSDDLTDAERQSIHPNRKNVDSSGGSSPFSRVHEQAREAMRVTEVALFRAKAASTTAWFAATRLRMRFLRAAKKFRFQIFLFIGFLLICASLLVLKSTANFEGILLDNIELLSPLDSSLGPDNPILEKTIQSSSIYSKQTSFDDSFTLSIPAPRLQQRIVHIDMKGLPPSPMYLLQLLGKFAEWGATGVMIEWEDMLPYYGALEFLSSPNAYSPKDVAAFCRQARQLGLRIIPVVPTVSGSAFILKHRRLSHLRERPESVDTFSLADPQSLQLVKLVLRQTMVLMELIEPDPQKDTAYIANVSDIGSEFVGSQTLEDELAREAENPSPASDSHCEDLLTANESSQQESQVLCRKKERRKSENESIIVHLGGSTGGSDTFAASAIGIDYRSIGMGVAFSQSQATTKLLQQEQTDGKWHKWFFDIFKSSDAQEGAFGSQMSSYSPMSRLIQSRGDRGAEKRSSQRESALRNILTEMQPPYFIGFPCKSCTSLGINSEAKIVSRHLGTLAKWLREKHGAGSMIWDEGVRSWDASELDRLADEEIQLGVRVFSPSLHSGSAPSVLRNYMWNTYRGVFPRDSLWATMAFKGADLTSAGSAVVSLRDRLENARNWLKLAAVNKLDRIILAGPSRASHIGPLYEPISAALPTLAITLQLFRNSVIKPHLIRESLLQLGMASSSIANGTSQIGSNTDDLKSDLTKTEKLRLNTNGVWLLSRPGELELRTASSWLASVDKLAFPGALAYRFFEQFQALRNVLSSVDHTLSNHVIREISNVAVSDLPAKHVGNISEDSKSAGFVAKSTVNEANELSIEFIPTSEADKRISEVVEAGKELLKFARGMLQAFFLLPDINEMLNHKLGKGFALTNKPFVAHKANVIAEPLLRVKSKSLALPTSLEAEITTTQINSKDFTPPQLSKRLSSNQIQIEQVAFSKLADSLQRLLTSKDLPTVLRRLKAQRQRRWLFAYGAWIIVPLAVLAIALFITPYFYELYKKIRKRLIRRKLPNVSSESSESSNISPHTSAGAVDSGSVNLKSRILNVSQTSPDSETSIKSTIISHSELSSVSMDLDKDTNARDESQNKSGLKSISDPISNLLTFNATQTSPRSDTCITGSALENNIMYPKMNVSLAETLSPSSDSLMKHEDFHKSVQTSSPSSVSICPQVTSPMHHVSSNQDMSREAILPSPINPNVRFAHTLPNPTLQTANAPFGTNTVISMITEEQQRRMNAHTGHLANYHQFHREGGFVEGSYQLHPQATAPQMIYYKPLVQRDPHAVVAAPVQAQPSQSPPRTSSGTRKKRLVRIPVRRGTLTPSQNAEVYAASNRRAYDTPNDALVANQNRTQIPPGMMFVSNESYPYYGYQVQHPPLADRNAPYHDQQGGIAAHELQLQRLNQSSATFHGAEFNGANWGETNSQHSHAMLSRAWSNTPSNIQDSHDVKSLHPEQERFVQSTKATIQRTNTNPGILKQ